MSVESGERPDSQLGQAGQAGQVGGATWLQLLLRPNVAWSLRLPSNLVKTILNACDMAYERAGNST